MYFSDFCALECQYTVPADWAQKTSFAQCKSVKTRKGDKKTTKSKETQQKNTANAWTKDGENHRTCTHIGLPSWLTEAYTKQNLNVVMTYKFSYL